MHVTEVLALLEQTAPPEGAASWDKSGIQVYGTRKTIKRLAVTLDPSEEATQKAIAQQADFLLAHHPLTLSPELPNQNNTYTRTLRLIFQSGIWLYAAHTSLDIQTSGPVSWLARELHLTQIRPISSQDSLQIQEADSAIGFGLIGQLPKITSWQKLAQELDSLLGISHWSAIGKPPQQIQKIAYCPGSGMDLARQAFDLGADIFISGDCKFHQAQEIGRAGFALDVGHFILEENMMLAWKRELKRHLSTQGVDVFFIPGKNPILIQAIHQMMQ